MNSYKCNYCSNNKLVSILDLGNQPLANDLKINAKSKQKKYPLKLIYCKKCQLLQLSKIIPKNLMFKNYLWVTGTSKAVIKYRKDFYKILKNKKYIQKKSKILEVASNDGTFLEYFKNKGHEVIGVDPAKNLLKVSNKKGVKTIADFFNFSKSKEITKKFGKFDFLFARNVIPHVSNLRSVIKGINNVLSDEGIGLIEFHNLSTIINELHFDSIYHEHLNYFSLVDMRNILRENSMHIFDIFDSPISGGSKVILFSKKIKKQSMKYKKLLISENKFFFNKLNILKRFAYDTNQYKKKLLKLIKLKNYKNICGYGASARSSTLLNFCGIDSKMMNYIFDKNSLKHNKFTPGTNIKIVNLNKIKEVKPDLIIILSWNFKKEIMSDLKQIGYKNDILIVLPNNPYYKKI